MNSGLQFHEILLLCACCFAVGWLVKDSSTIRAFRKDPTGTAIRLWRQANGDYFDR